MTSPRQEMRGNQNVTIVKKTGNPPVGTPVPVTTIKEGISVTCVCSKFPQRQEE